MTNRTFVNQLELQGGSLQAYTDDDGATYTRSTMGGSIGLAFDHQTIVAGKPGPNAPPAYQPLPGVYPNLVYYGTNDLYGADCAPSVDGGLNFLTATPVYLLTNSNCSRIFGHIKTDPNDGTLYLPPDGCGGKQAVYASGSSSLSWRRSDVPNTTDGDAGHPSLAVAKDSTVYYAYGSADTQSGSDYKTGRTLAPPSDSAR